MFDMMLTDIVSDDMLSPRDFLVRLANEHKDLMDKAMSLTEDWNNLNDILENNLNDILNSESDTLTEGEITSIDIRTYRLEREVNTIKRDMLLIQRCASIIMEYQARLYPESGTYMMKTNNVHNMGPLHVIIDDDDKEVWCPEYHNWYVYKFLTSYNVDELIYRYEIKCGGCLKNIVFYLSRLDYSWTVNDC